jgi:hypothetical protein
MLAWVAFPEFTNTSEVISANVPMLRAGLFRLPLRKRSRFVMKSRKWEHAGSPSFAVCVKRREIIALMRLARRRIPISACSGVRVFSAWLLPHQNGAIPLLHVEKG